MCFCSFTKWSAPFWWIFPNTCPEENNSSGDWSHMLRNFQPVLDEDFKLFSRGWTWRPRHHFCVDLGLGMFCISPCQELYLWPSLKHLAEFIMQWIFTRRPEAAAPNLTHAPKYYIEMRSPFIIRYRFDVLTLTNLQMGQCVLLVFVRNQREMEHNVINLGYLHNYMCIQSIFSFQVHTFR